MTPKAIAVASSKGGCGKTTVAACLAVRAAHDSGRVAVLDLDPQQALARWCELRNELVSPRLFDATDDVTAKVASLKASGWEWIIIDTPPSIMHLIESGIAAADFVLIPVRASPIDLESIDPAVELCEQYGKPYAFVITHWDGSWKLTTTAAGVLERAGTVLKEHVSYLAAYVGSMTNGRTGPEFKGNKSAAGKCKAEIDELWTVVKKIASAAAAVKVG